ncbi:GtrA family protein [Methylophilaceae bacterium]|nr:GtrA family protein [Methylophilaceae bacterium]
MIRKFDHSLLRFVINGFFATGVHYLVMLFVIKILNISLYSFAYAIAFIIAVTVSFWGNKIFVFKNKENKKYQFIKFFFLYIVILNFTSGVMWLISDYWNYHYNIGFMVAISIQFVCGYLGSRYFIFYG